ncbi:hypothetical protein E2C01_022718 [Portunus trituberculatus]|uniref:Uncharacterized protein n=1 Tax=Portunus trituberculatus TaxID=210409 RepID=A0A5B7E820_PORTR|nr:hypothetical protein [Portunus trituberculatus]
MQTVANLEVREAVSCRVVDAHQQCATLPSYRRQEPGTPHGTLGSVEHVLYQFLLLLPLHPVLHYLQTGIRQVQNAAVHLPQPQPPISPPQAQPQHRHLPVHRTPRHQQEGTTEASDEGEKLDMSTFVCMQEEKMFVDRETEKGMTI